MRINIKARLRNKTFVLSALALVISFVYGLLSMFDVVPSVGEKQLTEVLTIGVNILAFIGVLVDPTTKGINDSDRAMTYYTDNDMSKENVNG